MHARRFKFGVPMIAQEYFILVQLPSAFPEKAIQPCWDGNPPDKSAGRSFFWEDPGIFSVPDDTRIKRNPVPGRQT